jgi:tetratricopeptide (TPR) repeat protein
LANCAANLLINLSHNNEALEAYTASLRVSLQEKIWPYAINTLHNMQAAVLDQNKPAQSQRVAGFALELATITRDDESTFPILVDMFIEHSCFGQWAEADAMWSHISSVDPHILRNDRRPGRVEKAYALHQFFRGSMLEEHLVKAERIAEKGNGRATIRSLQELRGNWQAEKGEWSEAAENFKGAVRLARERGILNTAAETGLALAKQHLGQLIDAQVEAERLSLSREPSHRPLAQLWLALNEHDKAKEHALAAYKEAWADGEPYVHRYELNKATELLHQLGVPIPDLPPYDPDKDEAFPWEADVRAAIEKLRAEKGGKQGN